MASARRFGLGLGAAMIAALLVPVLAAVAPAAPPGGDRLGTYDPASAAWSLDGVPRFLYGNPGDQPFMGDWDCDGLDTPGLHRAEDTAAGPAGKVYLRNSQTTGIADVEYFFGNPGDQAFAGDFNGDGCDTVGLYRPSTGQVFLTNLLGARNRGIGAAQVTYDFPAQGRDLAGARALAADFDGDGIDTVALHLPATATVLGVGSAPVTFGNPGDHLVAGAWTGGTAALGAHRGTGFHLAGRDVTAAAAGGGVPLAWSASAASGPAPRAGGPCGAPTILGTPNADVINGTSGADVIDGLGGNDVIGGKAGNDTICGGDGNDVLNGDQGNDTVYGDAGDDNVNGNDGNDTLHGGDGADIVTGDKDDDTLFGDAGADNMNGGNGNDFVDGGGGDDLLSGSGGDDTLLGRAGADVLNGGPGFDTCDVGPDGTAATKCENGRPQAQNQSVAATEDGPAVSAAFATVDPDGNPTTYSLATSPAEGSVTNNGDRTFTFDPKPDFQNLAAGATRVVTFTYTATDSHGATSDVATVTITVTGVDDPPFAGDDAAGTDEDTAITTGDLLANDGDVDAGETVSLIAPLNGPPTTLPDPPSPGGIASGAGAAMFNNGDGTFSYDPTGAFQYLAAGEVAQDSLVYTIASTGGGTEQATLTITVTGVNDAPTADGQNVTAAGTTTITLTGSDPDLSDDLTFSVPGTTAAGGTLANLVNGPGNSATVVYTPPAGAPPDSFDFTADDGNGGSDTATVTINPDPAGEPTNQPPLSAIVAEDDEVGVLAGTPTQILIAAAAPPTMGDLAFFIETPPPAGKGSITAGPTAVPVNGPGDRVRAALVTYDPAAFIGATSFEFKACDAAALSNCDIGKVTIDVRAAAPPEPPVAATLSGTVNTNSSATINLAEPGQPNPTDEGPPAGRSHDAGAEADVYFLVDVTGSMSGALPGIESDIATIVGIVQASYPGAHFGLGTYDDIGTTKNPLPGPFPKLFENLVPLAPDDGAGGSTGDVSSRLATSNLAFSTGGDLPEVQWLALDRLASSGNPAGFDTATPSVIVYIGDAPGHDPVCAAVHGISGLGNVTEASVTTKLTDLGIAVVANSVGGAGLDAAPAGGDYADGTPPDCTPAGGSDGQATRLTGATGGSLQLGADAQTLANAIVAALDGVTLPAPDLAYSVLLPLEFAGTLKDSAGTMIPLGTAFALATPVVTYLSSGVSLGTQTSFSYTVTSQLTQLSATAYVFIDVRQVGACETDVDFCDDGRDGD